MAREIQDDFQRLQRFVLEYRLDDSQLSERFWELLSRQHKRYMAMLTVLSEIRHQQWHPLATTEVRAAFANTAFDERLDECLSDIGNALFAWIHGAYKASRIILRSGIENFLKAIGVTADDAVLSVRATYQVFDIVAQAPFFADPNHKARLHRLSDIYSQLSLDVHTATPDKMEHVGALEFFPRFSFEAARSVVTLSLAATSAMLAILCLMFPTVYHRAHHRNRDVINVSLATDVRAELNAVDRTEG